MALRCYFSGVESKVHWRQCVSAEVRNVLMSYFQFCKGDTSIVARRKARHPEMRFMVDSGAHSFIVDWEKFKSWKLRDFESYARGYAEWLEQNRKSLTVAVELDIDYCLNMVLGGSDKSTIGASIVERWQRDYFAPLEAKGLEIIYVWHENRGMEGWEDMCARHAYVGLPGEFSAKSDFNKYMTVARRYSTKVHGFAATKHHDFANVPWFSTDSITWKTGEMYGTLIDWDDRAQRLTFVDDKAERPLYRAKLAANGFNAEAVIHDTDYKEVTRYSLWSMRRMEKFYADKYANRLYYYQLRLPYVNRVLKMPERAIQRWWRKFRAESVFPQHAGVSIQRMRECLCAISAVQNAQLTYLTASKAAQSFLTVYFPSLINPFPHDFRLFQREMSERIAPTNEAALARTSTEHVLENMNGAKFRIGTMLLPVAESAVMPDWSTHPFLQESEISVVQQ